MANKRAGRAGHRWEKLKARVKREESVCHLCGQPIDKTLEWPHPMSFSVDHIEEVRVRPELAEVRENVRASHHSCNMAKRHGKRPAHVQPSDHW